MQLSENATGKDPPVIQQITELHQLAESDDLRCYNESNDRMQLSSLSYD
jgi:hypothetical protein